MSKTSKRERQKENRERARIERERMMKRDRRMKTARGVLFLLVPVVVIAIIISTVSGSDKKSFDKNKSYTATIETSEGTIVAALDAKQAPTATERFVELADQHYYDGKCFDRLSPDFVIQGGSPKCDQQGGEGHSVAGEVPTDHYPIGSLAAAKTGSDPAGTFDSQFFIMTGSKGATLPNDYARFGAVTSGLDVAQKIEKLAVKPGTEMPVARVTIKRIRITVTNQPIASTTTTAPPASTSSTAPAPSTTTAPPASTSSTAPAPSTTTTAAPSTTTSSKP